jgi:hypothetical protein
LPKHAQVAQDTNILTEMVFQTELLLLRNVSQGPENTHIDLSAIKKVFSPTLMSLCARIIFIVVLITQQRILGMPMKSRRFGGTRALSEALARERKGLACVHLEFVAFFVPRVGVWNEEVGRLCPAKLDF